MSLKGYTIGQEYGQIDVQPSLNHSIGYKNFTGFSPYNTYEQQNIKFENKN